MVIKLSNFGEFVSSKIFDRGLDYYESGTVSLVSVDNNGSYEFEVEGTEPYTVEIDLEGQVIADVSCTCPYNYGPICKHLVASFLYIERELQDQDFSGFGSYEEVSSKPLSKQARSSHPKIQKILDKATLEDLKKFIIQQSEYDSAFQKSLIAYFNPSKKAQNKPTANNIRKQIQYWIEKASDSDGFVTSRKSKKLGEQLDALLQKYQKSKPKLQEDYDKLVILCDVLTDEMPPIILHADDYTGMLYGIVDDTIDWIKKLLEDYKTPQTTKNALYRICWGLTTQKSYERTDFQYSFLQLAILGVNSNQKYKEINAFLDEEISKIQTKQKKFFNASSETTLKILSAQQSKLQIQFEGKNSLLDKLKQNPDDDKLRAMLIEHFFEIKSYNLAKTITLQGLKLAETKGKSALAWLKYLLKIAKWEKDKQQEIYYANLLFLDESKSVKELSEYYTQLKNLFNREEWLDHLEDSLIPKLKQHKSDRTLIYLYKKEKMWQPLLDILHKKPPLSEEALSYYAGKFPKEYCDQFYSLYIPLLQEQGKLAKTKKQYEEIYELLRQMKQEGAIFTVQGLIGYFLATYPKRRLFKELLLKL